MQAFEIVCEFHLISAFLYTDNFPFFVNYETLFIASLFYIFKPMVYNSLKYIKYYLVELLMRRVDA